MDKENINSGFRNDSAESEWNFESHKKRYELNWDSLADDSEKVEAPETREEVEERVLNKIFKSKKAKMIFVGIAAATLITSAVAVMNKPANFGAIFDNKAHVSVENELQDSISIYWANDHEMHVNTEAGDEVIEYTDVPEKYGDNDELMEKYNALIENANRFQSSDTSRIAMKEPVMSIPTMTVSPKQAIGGYTGGALSESSKTGTYNIDVSVEEATSAIAQGIDQISEELDIHESDDAMDRLRMCAALQEYIAFNNTYTDGLMNMKAESSADDMSVYDLYCAIAKKEGICSSNSIEMCTILRSKAGIDAECVALTSKEDGGSHMAVLVDVAGNGEYYYFDPTLEGSIFRQQCGEGASQDKMVLCCAGLGKSAYEAFYEPLGIVDINPETYRIEGTKPLPENISNGRIPLEVIDFCH